jgi:iron complex outermembrane receptor protein
MKIRYIVIVALFSGAAMATDGADVPPLTAAASATAPAEDSSQSSSSGAAKPSDVADIVITSQKGARGELAQKVPLAVTALSADALRAGQLNAIKDVGHVSPGVQLNEASFAGFANFYIRGIGLDGTVLTIEPAVSVVVDGMVNELLLGNILDTYDMQSVEVLRGPQGILFGRNATAGAVVFTSRRPTDKFEAEAHVTAATQGRLDVSALVSGPLVADLVKGKLSVFHSHTNGQFTDDNRGTFVPAPYNPSGVDPSARFYEVRSDIWAIRPTILSTPTSNLDISLISEFVQQKGTGGAGGRVVGRDGSSTGPFPANLLNLFGYVPPSGKRQINLDEEGFSNLDEYRSVAEIKWGVGPGVFTSVSGLRVVRYQGAFDGDATPFPLFEFPRGNGTNSTQRSEELRFASDFSDVFNFVVGGYYSSLSIDTIELRKTSFLTSGTANNTPRYVRGRFDQDGDSKAVFYNLEYRPIAKLRLSTGGRYTSDHKRITIVPLQTCGSTLGFFNCPDVPFNKKAKFSDFSPKFTAELQATAATMFYVSHTKGYRSGVFNGRATNEASIGPAQPETVQTWETGLKTTFLDGRARVNLAAYTENYKNIQRTISVNGIQTLGNAGSAKISGFELESTYRPFGGLELVGNASYVRARFNEFLGLAVAGPVYNPAVDPQLARQLRFNRVPEWTGYAGARYTWSLPADAQLTARANYIYQSSQFLDTLNELTQKAVGLLETSLNYRKGQWMVSLWGKNLTDRYFADQGTRFTFGPPPNNKTYVVYGGEPRAFGIDVGFEL